MSNYIVFMFLFAFVLLINLNDGKAVQHKHKILVNKIPKQTPTKFLEELEEQIDKMDKQVSQKLVNAIIVNSRNKRSDIDERLFELQAKILLTKAFANMPAGHGKFKFDEIGKRSDIESNLYRKLVASNEKYCKYYLSMK